VHQGLNERVRAVDIDADVIVIGSGVGGSTVAYGLAQRGLDVLVVERGTVLPREEANWDARAVYVERIYDAQDLWWAEREARWFRPRTFHGVGGGSKLGSASMTRFRETDFEGVDHASGTSRPWPFSYDVLEPWYGRAEDLFDVHGTPGEDPTEPWRSSDYPRCALDHDPPIAKLANELRRLGLHPARAPLAVDLREGGACLRCETCIGFPCKVYAKGDAERCALTPALSTGRVRLLENTKVLRLHTDPSGRRVTHAEGSNGDITATLRGRTWILSAGAVNSSALLLASTSDRAPNGLANSSGLVGRNLMTQNVSHLSAVDVGSKNTTKFEQTLMINDWYLDGPEGFPCGSMSTIGKLQFSMRRPPRHKTPSWVLNYGHTHSWDFGLVSEDLPDSSNRVMLNEDGAIVIDRVANNLRAHRGLITASTMALKSIGFALVHHDWVDVAAARNHCGTAVAGNDPATSVVDSLCRSHDVENLLVVDSSFLPSAAALDPDLTIAAQALRVAAEADVL
jgi:choline dehydrogenase-like flavoprotein